MSREKFMDTTNLQKMEAGDSALLNHDRIFNSNEFVADSFPSPDWLEDGTGYTLLEQSDAGQEIVQIDAKTGSRETLATSSQLIPTGETAPLQVKGYSLSKDCAKLLIFSNTNHYWVLDRSTWNLHKLGNDSYSGNLMNVEFSPDGQKVAYVSQSNIFLENLSSGQRIQLTEDGSDTTINGNLAGLHSGLNTRGFRWSPDGSQIAYVQFDTMEVRDFCLINNTDSLYSKIIPLQHVKPGEVLPACRAGFVSASGGETIWIDTQGDPRNHYIIQLCWTPDSKNVVIQQLNRRQNTIKVMFVERNTGLVQTVLTDGMPANQTVLDRWNGLRYMWHLMLTQLGYIVMSLDNRGTPAPRGRAWRKIIYRKHGILPADDQASAVRTLIAQRPYVDAERIGVYGWSGGGCISLHLIFRYPDLYKMAMPGAGITHHKFYTASFTERFLGLPQDNPEDYEKTAVLNMAENLKGDLLVIHGTGDSNVHYQSTEALIEKLVSLNKRFTMMAYPNGSHGLGSSRATRRHLYDLYTWYLSQNLPAGPR